MTNIQITNLSISVAVPEWGQRGSVSASFSQRVQGGRLNMSGTYTIPTTEVKDFDDLSTLKLISLLEDKIKDAIVNGEDSYLNIEQID